MTKPTRRYWAERTDPDGDIKKILMEELRQGRLRQGWGGDADQDLRVVQAKIVPGTKWKDGLSEKQKDVLLHLKMLSSANDSVQLGDWILVPNLPDYGSLVVVEVVGDYYFEPFEMKKQGSEPWTDYGHILPVRLLTDRGINKYSDHVHADIRNTLKAQNRMWNLDKLSDKIEKLVQAYMSGSDLSNPKSGEARLNTAAEAARSHVIDQFKNQLKQELDKHFQAAEWEEALKEVLKKLYPGAEIRHTGGRNEHGADLVVQMPNHFGTLPWLILVQVKNYVGQQGSTVLKQLKDAFEHYSKEGTVLSLVVMTTAEQPSADLLEEADLQSQELGVPIEIVLQKDMLEIFSKGLFPSTDFAS